MNLVARSTINLGELAAANDKFVSGIDVGELSDRVGYEAETLAAFGEFDDSIKKMLNPDIDSNGIYDVDENFLWKLS